MSPRTLYQGREGDVNHIYLYVYQALIWFLRFGAMKPCLYRTPDKENLAGRWFEVMDVLPKLLPPDQIADGTWSHLDPSTKLYSREIFFHMAIFSPSNGQQKMSNKK